jgi:hypothetical protein
MKRIHSYFLGSVLGAAVGGYLLLRPADPQVGSAGGPLRGSGEEDQRWGGNASDGDGKTVFRSSKVKDRTVDKGAQGKPKKLPQIALRSDMDQTDRRAMLADLMARKGLEGLAGLLQQYGNDPDVPGLPPWLVADLKETIAKAYLEGQLGSASELLDVLGSGYTNPQRVVEEICETLVDSDHPEQAFLEVLENPTKITPRSYKFLFGKAGHLIGPSAALAQVDQFGSGEVSRVAGEMIFQEWLALNPELALQYIDALPEDSWLREQSPRIIVHYVANRDDYERAEQWVATIKDPALAKRTRRDLEIIRKAQKQGH